jgi:hypothetical protein
MKPYSLRRAGSWVRNGHYNGCYIRDYDIILLDIRCDCFRILKIEKFLNMGYNNYLATISVLAAGEYAEMMSGNALGCRNDK